MFVTLNHTDKEREDNDYYATDDALCKSFDFPNKV